MAGRKRVATRVDGGIGPLVAFAVLAAGPNLRSRVGAGPGGRFAVREVDSVAAPHAGRQSKTEDECSRWPNELGPAFCSASWSC